VYRAGTWAAWIAAGSARSARDPGFRIRSGADGKDRQLFVELGAVASWTSRLLTLPSEKLESMTAVAAGKLEQRHTAYYEAVGV